MTSTFKNLPQTIKTNDQHMLVDTTCFLFGKDFTRVSSYLHVTALEVSALLRGIGCLKMFKNDRNSP